MSHPGNADLPGVMSPADPVTVLVVDDLPASRGLAAIWLSDGLRDSVRVVEAATLAEMRAAWRAERPDVVLLDHHLPDGEGLEAARELLAEDPDAAIVLLTGMGDPALDQEAERVGITDFLVKHEIDGPMLARTVRYALRRREDRRRLRHSEERYRNLVSALPDTGVLVVDDQLRFVMAAGSALEDAGWDPEAIVGRDAAEVLRGAGRDAMLDHYEAALAGEAHETVTTSPNGRTYRTAFRPLEGHEAMAVTFDITEQLAAAAELQRAQALAHTGSWQWDAAREEMTWSPELCRIYGMDPSARLPTFGDWLRTMVVEADRERAAHVTRAAVRDGESSDFDLRVVRADGEERVLATRVRPVPGPDGAIVRVEGISQDVTELRRAQEALRAGEERMRLVLGNLPRAVVAVYDTELRCTLVAGGTLPSEAYASLEPALIRALMGEESEVDVAVGDGARELVLTVAPHHDLHGAPAGAIVVARDVTAERAAERARRNAERQFEVAFDRAPIGMFLSSLDGRFLRVNDALCALVDHEPDALVGGDPLALIPEEDVDEVAARLAAIGDDDVTLEHRMRHRDGHDVWVAVNATLVRDDEGRPVHVLGQMRDVTERREHERQLRHLADHDPLTGLLNRRGFEAALTAHVARTRRYGAAGALLVLDLDNFKHVNDTHGHHAGDALLSEVADGLRERVRETDVLARLGGDEFAVLLPVETAAQAEVAAAALVAVVRERGQAHGVTASLGVAPVDATVTDGEELLVRADRAMYAAKAAGRDGVAHAPRTSRA
jgi:diguanylate cyclase (GGDEF)-like protein/PAS domain S-box-containing protein